MGLSNSNDLRRFLRFASSEISGRMGLKTELRVDLKPLMVLAFSFFRFLRYKRKSAILGSVGFVTEWPLVWHQDRYVSQRRWYSCLVDDLLENAIQ